MFTKIVASFTGAIKPSETKARTDACTREYIESVELVRGIRNTANSLRGDQVRHWSLPASQISADFFCAAEHPEKGWYGLLADTAGHGLASAVFSLHTPALFREAVCCGLSLPEIYARLHNSLTRQNSLAYFVCGLLVRIHGREIEILNAGMPDALLLAAGGRVLATFPSAHLPFGVTPACVVGEQRYRLTHNDDATLLMFSDGLVDLGVLTGKAFGLHGVKAVIQAAANDADMDSLVDRLIARIDAHEQASQDDISIVMIKAPFHGANQIEPTPLAEAFQLDANDAKLHLVEHYPRGLMLTDAEQKILYVNPAFSTITGHSLADAVGKTPRILNSGRHSPDFYRELWKALYEKYAWSGAIWNRHKDGTLYREWVDIYALLDDAGLVSHYLAGFTDISQQQQRDESGLRVYLYDPLTNLAGKLLLADRGEQALRRVGRAGRSMAVLFIDLDRFNSVNNTLGHDIGDQVLATVASLFSGELRNDDTLSRFGSDEFICLLPDLAERLDAIRVATNLLAVLDEPIEIAGHKLKISASIGISVYPSDAQDLDHLIIQADQAMQSVKRDGGNLFRFYSAKESQVAERQLDLEARLDAAICNCELELFYQPKMDLLHHTYVGAEALVRWRDPQRGLIPPGEFIPVAEQSDLIVKIGSWVLTEACTAIARWEHFLPPGFNLAINVSPMQLVRCDMFEAVRAALEATGIDPARLQLEVTESLFIRDAENAIITLDRICKLGVTIALDDFGTGYSNLSSLCNLPLDTLKLDQAFVRDIHLNRANRAIAEAVIALSRGLGKNVVAEGIESCEECIQLKSFGYRIGQGYKYGKPMPEAELLAYLGSDFLAHHACSKHPDSCLPPHAVNKPLSNSQLFCWF